MFSKSSNIMLLVAGLLLLTACLIDNFNSKSVNHLYLALGIVFVLFSSGMLIFKSGKRKAESGE